jgi:hypothetical protein
LELAVNHSSQAAALLTAGEIAFDRWKCSDWPELVTGARATRLPAYVHFALQAGPGTTHAELHVSGVERDEDGNPREHIPMSDDDWALVAWCLEQIPEGRWARPWVLAFEYGGIGPLMEWRSDERVLAEQVPRLAGLAYDAGSS